MNAYPFAERAIENTRREYERVRWVADAAADLFEHLPATMEGERIRRGLSRTQASRQLAIGIDTWDSYVSGRRGMTAKVTLRVLRWLGADEVAA
jgi:hypothetical protein